MSIEVVIVRQSAKLKCLLSLGTILYEHSFRTHTEAASKWFISKACVPGHLGHWQHGVRESSLSDQGPWTLAKNMPSVRMVVYAGSLRLGLLPPPDLFIRVNAHTDPPLCLVLTKDRGFLVIWCHESQLWHLGLRFQGLLRQHDTQNAMG